MPFSIWELSDGALIDKGRIRAAIAYCKGKMSYFAINLHARSAPFAKFFSLPVSFIPFCRVGKERRGSIRHTVY